MGCFRRILEPRWPVSALRSSLSGRALRRNFPKMLLEKTRRTFCSFELSWGLEYQLLRVPQSPRGMGSLSMRYATLQKSLDGIRQRQQSLSERYVLVFGGCGKGKP